MVFHKCVKGKEGLLRDLDQQRLEVEIMDPLQRVAFEELKGESDEAGCQFGSDGLGEGFHKLVQIDVGVS